MNKQQYAIGVKAMTTIEYAVVGGQETWLLVNSGEQVMAAIVDDGDEFVALVDGEPVACARALNEAAALALNALGHPLELWPVGAQAAFAGKVAVMETHPDDWDQW
jgi:hypothetical protein